MTAPGRSGQVTLGVLVVLPSLFAGMAAQVRVGGAMSEHRHALAAGTDAARHAGARIAEGRNYSAMIGQIATTDLATLAGLEGLVAAASTSSPAQASAYAARISTTRAGLLTMAKVQETATAGLGAAIREELERVRDGHHVGDLRLFPPDVPWAFQDPAESCAHIADVNPLLGLAPSASVELTASGISAGFVPDGPVAFATAFSAALATCATRGLVPGLHLAASPHREAYSIALTRGGGRGVTGFLVVQTGEQDSPSFAVELLTGPEVAGDVTGSGPFSILAP